MHIIMPRTTIKKITSKTDDTKRYANIYIYIQKTNSKEREESPTIQIITLNLNQLNTKYLGILCDWIKQDSTTCCQQRHLRFKDTSKVKVLRLKKTCHANGNYKRAGVAILVSDKTHKRQERDIYIPGKT